MFSKSFDRDRQIYLSRLADALARPGKQQDLEAAASHSMAALQLAESLESERSVRRIRELQQLMAPHTNLPAVREFMERARAVTSG